MIQNCLAEELAESKYGSGHWQNNNTPQDWWSIVPCSRLVTVTFSHLQIFAVTFCVTWAVVSSLVLLFWIKASFLMTLSLLFFLQWLCRWAHGLAAFPDTWHVFKWSHVRVFWFGIFLEVPWFCLFCDHPGNYCVANISVWLKSVICTCM